MPRYPGGLIRKTPVTPAGPLQNGAAPGVWTLAEATYWTKQGLWPIAGNFLAVEDVFSTYLYTGNSSTQTITNGIDLAGKGGLVWLKRRNNADSHILTDSARGFGATAGRLNSDSTGTPSTLGTLNITASSSGFSLVGAGGSFNYSGETYASWTFREAPKFFDVVTYTGNGASGRTIAHNLGVVPGMILVKRTDVAADWQVYHRSNANTEYMVLNTTAAKATGTTRWNSTTPTATEFTVGTDTTVNASGGTYVAYLFAHDATADGIIQCGSYTGNGSTAGPDINLGWEPQYLMIKNASGTGNWQIVDNMRGTPVGAADATLQANLSNAESSVNYVSPAATGFQIVSSNAEVNTNASTYIYIAIRRGPMKTPTVGTSVFAPATRTGTGTTAVISSTTFPPDLLVTKPRTGADPAVWFDRLRGRALSLTSNSTTADTTTTTTTNDLVSFNMNGITVGANQQQAVNSSGVAIVDWNFRRAPGFFDVVCYTGTGSSLTVNHSLGVAPELMIVKGRSGATAWQAYSAGLANTEYLVLNTTAAKATGTTRWNSTTPSATTFTVGTATEVNTSAATYVAYLFASCPGVSKVGSYTGNGSSQTINCGFSSGARFFLVKRTDSTGDWWVWDSARGITAPADPALRLNSTAAEVTSADATDPDNSGIIVNQETTCNINVNGATYIFLAIA